MLRIPLLTTIVVNFGIWSTRSFTDFPEVRLARHPVFFRNTAFDPKVVGIFVIRIIGDIKLVRIKTIVFFTGQEFISPRDDFRTEVITNGEVSHPFEESVVTGCMSDIINIVGTNALLCVGDSTMLWSQCTIKILL